MSRPYLGEILLERGLVSEEQIAKALASQNSEGGRIGEILVTMGALSRDDLFRALADQLGILYMPAIDSQTDPELVRNIPIQFAKTHEMVPISRDDGVVRVATSDPLNFFALDDMRKLLEAEIETVLVPGEVVIQAINKVYDRASVTAQGVMGDLDKQDLDLIAQELEEPEDLLDVSDEAPIIRLVNSLLFQAVKERASDIHIEPFERDIVVRFRIDGVLYEILRPPKRFQSSIASRIKIMGGLNIAEKRLPQDGRIRLKIAGKDIDI